LGTETIVNKVIDLEECDEKNNSQNKATIALEYLKRDLMIATKFSLLYSDPLNHNEVAYTVGGRNIVLSAYHFDSKNSLSIQLLAAGSSGSRKKFDLVHSETSDTLTLNVPKLYCWILKAAIAINDNDKYVGSNIKKQVDECNSTVNEKPKANWKVLFEMCVVHHLITDKIYIILAILTTMCDEPRQDFMVKDMDCDTINIWQGLTEVRFCYALPEVEIDYDHCHKLRMQYWTERFFFYDPSKKIPIDIHLSLINGNLNDQVSLSRTAAYQKLNEVTNYFIFCYLIVLFYEFL
jgi:hypothetical protein